MCIDSPLRGLAMPKAYSCDLREHVIEAVKTGASRREAVERFEVSVSSAVKCRIEAARWKHFSARRVRQPSAGSDCRTTGSDLAGNRCGVAQAADSNQPQLALALSRST